jgi:kumamolisin
MEISSFKPAQRILDSTQEVKIMNPVSIPNSDRKAMRGSKMISPARPDERLQVTVRLRRHAPLPADAVDGTRPPRERTYLTHAQLESRHGANPTDVAKVESFARAAGLTVVNVRQAERSIILSGTVAAFEKAFGVKLAYYAHPTRGRYRGRTGSIYIPGELDKIIEGVFGLDNRPFAKPHTSRRNLGRPAAAQFNGFTPPQVSQFYNFPPGLDGSGETIGIIELGGGFRQEDLVAYFNQINVPVPQVTAFNVDNGDNSPSTPSSADQEVMLDIEVAGSVAPKAKIVVYFAAGVTDQDFLDAITTAVHDGTNNPSVISISWGGPTNGTSSPTPISPPLVRSRCRAAGRISLSTTTK